jgi:hypothetical protein
MIIWQNLIHIMFKKDNVDIKLALLIRFYEHSVTSTSQYLVWYIYIPIHYKMPITFITHAVIQMYLRSHSLSTEGIGRTFVRTESDEYGYALRYVAA